MQITTDQMGRQVAVPEYPKRIISLVPSQTELLADLGLGERVVGVTKFCVHPASWRKEKAIVGGTKQFRMDVIEQLKPDLIIGNKEENYQEGIEELSAKYPVWMSDIVTFDDALNMIERVGDLVGEAERAEGLCREINQQFGETPSSTYRPKVLYLIWKNPYMAAGTGTFINEMLGKGGFQNVLEEERYPELSETTIADLQADIIMLSSEPFPFKEQHIEELKKLCPKTQVLLVDGELFSWYGSRLLKSAKYLVELAKKADWLA